jgi:hypothetical protein
LSVRSIGFMGIFSSILRGVSPLAGLVHGG